MCNHYSYTIATHACGIGCVSQHRRSEGIVSCTCSLWVRKQCRRCLKCLASQNTSREDYLSLVLRSLLTWMFGLSPHPWNLIFSAGTANLNLFYVWYRQIYARCWTESINTSQRKGGCFKYLNGSWQLWFLTLPW